MLDAEVESEKTMSLVLKYFKENKSHSALTGKMAVKFNLSLNDSYGETKLRKY